MWCESRDDEVMVVDGLVEEGARRWLGGGVGTRAARARDPKRVGRSFSDSHFGLAAYPPPSLLHSPSTHF